MSKDPEGSPSVVESGVKRALQDSPSRVDQPKKRTRTKRAERTGTVAAEGIDLGDYTFEEDSVVDTTLVPLAQGKVSRSLSFVTGLLIVVQVCSTCRTKKKRGCVPIWHLNKSLVTVRCLACMKDKQGCSFKEWDWGISVLPQLTKTESGVARRAREHWGQRGCYPGGKLRVY